MNFILNLRSNPLSSPPLPRTDVHFIIINYLIQAFNAVHSAFQELIIKSLQILKIYKNFDKTFRDIQKIKRFKPYL